MNIPFFMHGVFSYFLMSKPSLATLEVTYEIYLMTLEVRWNPVSYAYTTSKDIIMDWEGNITENQDRIQVMLENV